MKAVNDITDVVSSYKTVIQNGEEIPTSDYYDASKDWQQYTDSQRQALSWTTKFKTGDNAEQYQKQLVALPIIQNTPNVRRGEIVQVLNKLYNNWQTQPNRPTDESWLEFARSKNYWGLAPSYAPSVTPDWQSSY